MQSKEAAKPQFLILLLLVSFGSVGAVLFTPALPSIAGRFSLIRLLLSGILGLFIASLTMLIPFSMGIVNPMTLFVPMFLIYFAESLVFADISSFGLSHAKNKSNGSAVLNFINLGTPVVAVFLAEIIYPEAAVLLLSVS